MLTATEQKLLELAQLTWPITIRFHTEGTFGASQQELTVDAPGLLGSIEGSMLLGDELWRRLVATATCRDVELVRYETVMWKLAPTPFVSIPLFGRGLLSDTPATREATPVLVMHTGHDDARARRSFFLYGAPADWSRDGVMTKAGLRAVEGWGQMALMGLCSHLTGSPFVWHLAYPEALPASAGNGNGVAFRRVEFLRCCWHTERAPDPSPLAWP